MPNYSSAQALGYRVDYYAPDPADGTIRRVADKNAAIALGKEIAKQRLKVKSDVARVEVIAIMHGATGPQAQPIGVYRYGKSGVRWTAHKATRRAKRA